MIKRKPKYFVKRVKHEDGMRYFVYVSGTPVPRIVIKTCDGWYAQTLYHATLRDAIIYCAYGV